MARKQPEQTSHNVAGFKVSEHEVPEGVFPLASNVAKLFEIRTYAEELNDGRWRYLKINPQIEVVWSKQERQKEISSELLETYAERFKDIQSDHALLINRSALKRKIDQVLKDTPFIQTRGLAFLCKAEMEALGIKVSSGERGQEQAADNLRYWLKREYKTSIKALKIKQNRK